MKIQKELDETKIVLHKTIESVLERGEKIDSLVEKSDGLSAQSKMFYSKHLVQSLDGIFEQCADITFYRTGKAAKFLLCNHVIHRNAHSIGGRVLSSSCQHVFRSLVASSLGSGKRCRPNIARPDHSST